MTTTTQPHLHVIPAHLRKQLFSHAHPGKFRHLDSVAENILDFNRHVAGQLKTKGVWPVQLRLHNNPHYLVITGASAQPYLSLHAVAHSSILDPMLRFGIVSPSATESHPMITSILSRPFRITLNTGHTAEIKARWALVKAAELRSSMAVRPGRPCAWKVGVHGKAGRAGVTLGCANGVVEHTLIGRVLRAAHAWVDSGYEVFWSPGKASGNVSFGARGVVENEGVEYILTTYGSVLGNFTATYAARAKQTGLEAATRWRYNYTTRESSFAVGLGLWQPQGGLQLRYDTAKGSAFGVSVRLGSGAALRLYVGVPSSSGAGWTETQVGAEVSMGNSQ